VQFQSCARQGCGLPGTSPPSPSPFIALVMFAPAIGRVVRSPNTLPAHSVCTLGRPAVISAASQTPFRPSHQRRLSSSKASVPPDGSNTNGSSSAQQTPANASKAPAKKVASRTNRKRASTVSSVPVPKNVPRVPPTDHLQKPGKGRPIGYWAKYADAALRCEGFLVLFPSPPHIARKGDTPSSFEYVH